jgi:transporter family protein
MAWLFLAIISAILGGLTRVLQKVLLTEKDSDPYAFTFIFQITVAFFFLLYLLVTKSMNIPNLSGVIFNIILMMVFYGVGNLFTFKAFKLAEASEVAVIFASSTLWSVISAFFILGEKITNLKIVGIILVIFGLIVINYVKTSWKINRGHLFALLAAVLFGVAFTNDLFIMKRFSSVASYSMFAFSLPSLVPLIFNPKSIKHVPYFLKGKVFLKLAICSFIYAADAFAIYIAYKMGGPATAISPISATSLIFTVVISYIFLKERDRVWNKIFGTLLTLIGIFLLI